MPGSGAAPAQRRVLRPAPAGVHAGAGHGLVPRAADRGAAVSSGCLSAGAPGSLLAAAPPRPPFPQPLAQFLQLRSRRLQFAFQPLLSLYRLAMHSAVIARLPAQFYYLAPQLGYLAPACRRAAFRTSPESSHTSFLSTPFRLCPELPHRYTEYLRGGGGRTRRLRHQPVTALTIVMAIHRHPLNLLECIYARFARPCQARGISRNLPRARTRPPWSATSWLNRVRR